MIAGAKELNELNTRMQGQNENFLTSRPTDKINGFRSKLVLWQQYVKNSVLDMFPLTQKCQTNVNTAALCETIQKHLKTLQEKFPFHFPSITTECFDWVRDPYSSATAFETVMTFQEQEEFVQLRQDRS